MINSYRQQAPPLNIIRQRTAAAIEDAYRDEGSMLIHAPPGSGKTTAALRKASFGTPITYLTPRTDLYQQAKDLCQQEGHSHRILSSPHRSCPTFQGQHSEDLQRRLERYYSAGVGAMYLHSHFDLPCEPGCPYIDGWDFDPEDFQVLIGHYTHAYVPEVTASRIIVFDEFPEGAFERKFSSPEQRVSTFLQQCDGIPFQNWTDLIQNRHSGVETVLRWFADYGPTLPPWQIVNSDTKNSNLHTSAAILTFGLFLMDDLGNNFATTNPQIQFSRLRGYGTNEIQVPLNEYVPWRQAFPSQRKCVWDRCANTMWLLNSPDLSRAAGIVGLDGTPVERLWNLVLSEDFTSTSILSGNALNAYIQDTLGIEIYQVASSPKPYSSGNNISFDKDESLLLAIELKHGAKPILITTKKTQKRLLDRAKGSTYYGQMLSSNEFGEEQLGIVSGTVHPGDTTIKKWAAYMGKAIERSGRGAALPYGSLGNDILALYRECQVVQALLRLGRKGQGATVYLNTNAVPDWLNAKTDFDPSIFKGEKTRHLVDELRNAGPRGMTASELASDLDVSRSQVYRVLKDLSDRGYLSSTNEAKSGKIYSWNPDS